MRKEKQIVKDFYDTYGWEKNEDGIYLDTATFVDTRPALGYYYHESHMRVKNFINSTGEYFLDAGSGAIPYVEYLEYSSDFKWRVCIDFSKKALVEARSKLKEKGLYVIADITRLPFKDGIFDSTVSAHVLYHIPSDEQKSAVLELQRTIKHGGSCVIIYTWPGCLLTKIARGFNIRRMISKISRASSVLRKSTEEQINKGQNEGTYPSLYFHPHDYRWFQKNIPEEWDVDIRCWRCADSVFTKTFVPDNFFGRFLIGWIFQMENLFPHVLARIGRYPMIIIHKK
jgi:ubiquinone/menaquinone biosynthesis C-methylase UbiE